MMTDAEIAGYMNWRGPGAYTAHAMKRVSDRYAGSSPVDRSVSRRDCYSEDGAPVKCWNCGSREQREVVRSMVDMFQGQGPVCEYEVFCVTCGEGIGYWAYGAFDPGYVRDVTDNAKVS